LLRDRIDPIAVRSGRGGDGSCGRQAAAHRATSADSRAVGCGDCVGGFDIHGNYTGSGPIDGVVLLNIDAPLAFTRTHGTIGAKQYDARSVLQHEVDEVLGIGGAGSALNDASAQGVNGPSSIDVGGTNLTYISPLHLYRY